MSELKYDVGVGTSTLRSLFLLYSKLRALAEMNVSDDTHNTMTHSIPTAKGIQFLTVKQFQTLAR